MFLNYLKSALRNFLRHKTVALINVLSLSIGLACCIMVFLFVRSESGYDSYHVNKDNIYRMTLDVERLSNNEIIKGARTSILWAPVLKKDYSEISNIARVLPSRDPTPFRLGDQTFQESNYVFADPSVFQMFSWPVLQGDTAGLLSEKYKVVISERIAKKYFGDQPAVGQIFEVDGQERDENGQEIDVVRRYEVQAVMQNIPFKSHLKPDFVISFITLNDFFSGDVNAGTHPQTWFWRGRIVHTYLQLHPQTEIAALEAKFPDFLERYVGDATVTRGYQYHPYLQSLPGIHLEGTEVGGTIEPGGDARLLYLFAVVAVIVLLIACINFMNLATARSTTRAREVGIRKVVGADRISVIRQFIGESVLMSFISLFFALILVEFFNPVFYEYVNAQFYLNREDMIVSGIAVLMITLLVGIFAGSYPAFFLSAFRPALVLKGSQLSGGAKLRKSLVVLQFGISIFFIFGALTVYHQLHYMKTYDLGFKSDQVVVLPPSVGADFQQQNEAFRNALMTIPAVKNVTVSSVIPGRAGGGDIWGEEGMPGEEGVSLNEFNVDYDFRNFYDLTLVAGRDFDPARGSDALYENREDTSKVLAGIINRAAVEQFGWSSVEEALGKKVVRDPVSKDFTCEIIGVIDDFHYQSLHNAIDPMIMFIHETYRRDLRYISVELAGSDIAGGLEQISKAVSPFLQEAAFDYFFLDAEFAELYEGDQRRVEVFGYVSALAIIIACLGLFGLSSFSSEQRSKEVGIRKVMGASVPNIVRLLSLDYVKLILIAMLLSWPAAYYIMSGWLEQFAYRLNIGGSIFFSSGVIAVLIALATVSYQSIRAALANPVDAIRQE